MAKKKSPPARKYKDIAAWIKDQPQTERTRLRAALTELRKLFKGPQQDDLCWWHRVGKRMLALQPKEDRRYGSNVMELLANYLQPDREWQDKRVPNLLYRTRDFADKYSWREAQALDKARREKRLTSLHIVALVSLEDKGLREKLLKQCLAENWSGQRLRREIQNKVGRKRSSGGLSPTPPENSSPGVALRDISILSRRWMTNYEVWFVGKRAPLGSDEIKACNEAMLKDTGAAIQGLTDVRDAVREQLKRLRQYERDIKESLRTKRHRSK